MGVKYHNIINQIISEKSPQIYDLIKKEVLTSDVDSLHSIFSFRDPFDPESLVNGDKKEVTLLSLAAFNGNLWAAKALIELGANSFGGKVSHFYPINVAMHMGKSNKDSLEVFMYLLKIKGNASFKINEMFLLDILIDSYPIETLGKIFPIYPPETLTQIHKVFEKNEKQYNQILKKKPNLFSPYPLINDIIEKENRSVSFTNRAYLWKDHLESFFKEKSIKEALRNRYGISSERFTSLMSHRVFHRVDNIVKISIHPLLECDTLKSLFLEGPSANHSDFMDQLEKIPKSNVKAISEMSSPEAIRFLRTFTTAQLKTLLENKSTGTHILDLFRMEEPFHERLLEARKRVSFSEINSFTKLHDWVTGEVNKYEQENFSLDQEYNFKSLKKLPLVKLPEKYGIIIAQDSHELISWGSKMGHCVGGGYYAKSVKKGDIMILGITFEGDPKWCVEIDENGHICQIQGASYSRPPDKVIRSFISELKKIQVLNNLQTSDPWTKNK